MVDPHPLPLEVAARPESRRFAGLLIITSASALILGFTLKVPSMLEVNDISRWCTVWSLVERGSYVIATPGDPTNDCPWQHRTQDKVLRPDKLVPPGPDASPIKKLEYALAPAWWKEGPTTLRYYSSKPPLLPTLIAGLLYPARQLSGVPLESSTKQPRNPRNVEEPVVIWPGVKLVLRFTKPPGPPHEWPNHVYYFKPILILLNVVPYFVMLLLYARMLDRHAVSDWSWLFSLTAAAFATQLFAFSQTLNNHTVAAWSAFFATYHLIRIAADGRRSLARFAAAGFFAAFAACNEIPAALFLVLLGLALLVIDFRRTLLGFVPAALLPVSAFLITQFLAFGQFTPVYEEFGTQSYNFSGSYWLTPLEFDYFNKHPEPWPVYLFHMTFGHHGLFSLTPVLLLALWGAWRWLIEPREGMRIPSSLAIALTVAMLAFYTWNPKARNYGGSTQGLRWLFWVFPLLLLMLPRGVEAGQRSRFARGFTLVLLAISVISVGYALRFPWSHPWIVEMLERMNRYTLQR